MRGNRKALTTADESRAGGNERELSARVATDPSDLEARLALAGALAAGESDLVSEYRRKLASVLN